MKNKLFRRFDAALIALVALLSLLLFLFFSPRGTAVEAVVSYRGEVVDRVTLSSEPFERVYTTEKGDVCVRFESDGASVLSSPCAGQNCVHTAKISKAGASVLCVPRGFSVVLSGEGAFDGVTG